MNKWLVKLYAEGPDGRRHFIAKGEFWADTEKDAEECALCAWWSWDMEPMKHVVEVEAAP
jgi:hypothetical protein